MTPEEKLLHDIFSKPEPKREDHDHWASVCTCGMAEQERTGHYPEHQEWCEVPSPLEDDTEPTQ